MRTAVLFAPLSHSSEASQARCAQGAAWFSAALERWEFRVVRVGQEADALAELERTLAYVGQTLGEGDSVLVHVIGELRSTSSLIVGADEVLPLSELTRVMGLIGSIADRGTGRVLALAELTHATDSGDPLSLADEAGEIREALTWSGRQSALVALHGRSHEGDRFAFTRLVIQAATDLLEEGCPTALVSEVVERLRDMPESHAVSRNYSFSAGDRDFEFAVTGNDDASLDAPQSPDVDLLIQLADGARESRAFAHALAAYRAALRVCPDEGSRGGVYALIGEVERASGRTQEARRAYQKARRACPTNRSVLDALIEIETEAEKWSRVIDLASERVALLETSEEKVGELFSLARLTVERLRDMPRAVVHLEAARAIDTSDEDVLEALRRSYKVLMRWQDLIDVTGALAERAPTAPERAARRFAQAQIARKDLDDAGQAVRFLWAALEADPTHDEALDLLCEIEGGRGETEGLSHGLSSVLERLLDLGEDERGMDVARRLSSLGSSPVSPASKSGESSGEAPAPPPNEEHEARCVELEAAVLRAPLASDAHEGLFALYARMGRTDRAYLSALALEELGPLDPSVVHVLEECRPDGLRLRAPLDAAAWTVLRAPGADEVLEALVGAVGRAAGIARSEDKKTKKRDLILDEAQRQPGTSTASIVRSFHWAAEAIGVKCPDLYVLDEVPGDILAVPGAELRTALGPNVLRGLSMIDLAFVCARHLTYCRPEYSALIDFPTVNELSVLVLSALQLALPSMPVPSSVAAPVAALRNGLRRHLSPAEHDAMNEAVSKLDARAGRMNLQGWIRGVELTAARVGLMLCGDLRAAMSRIRGESRVLAELSIEEKRHDLVAFCVSEGHALLRTRFAVTVSATPQPRESGILEDPNWKSASEQQTGSANF
jgi:tetratricopeptide (TPR) repeat protein